LKTIYFAFVHPHILYGTELYANTAATNLHNLIILNNRLLRILQKKWTKYPTKDLYINYNVLPIPQLHLQQILLLVHTLMYRKYLLPKVFANYFDLNRSIYSYNRHGSNNLHIISVHYNNYGKPSVKYKASSLWNRLLNSINSKSSKMQFLRQIKLFLQSVHNSVQ